MISLIGERKAISGERVRHLLNLASPGRLLLWKILIGVLAYTAVVCLVDNHDLKAFKLVEANAAISISAVVGLLLIFRNNSAYERWWEARKLWGQLVNESRNLAIKTRSYADELSESERLLVANLISGFAEALKIHLRNGRDVTVLFELYITDRNQHVPSSIALQIYRKLKTWRRVGLIDDFEQIQLDRHARTLMDICGACERILKSPIAGSYKFLLWIGLLLNVICVPWFIVPAFHWWAVPIMAISSYFTFGLELLAEEVERPFDDLPNDLPLDSICSVIKLSVQESLEVETFREPASTAY